MSKIVFLPILFIFLSLLLSCSRAVTIPVRVVVDWTEEENIKTESFHNLKKSQ